MDRQDILQEPELHLKGKQKEVYKLPFKGNILVKGSAGSGKTLVAIARARHLRNMYEDTASNVRIAFFTYDKSLRDEIGNYLNTPAFYVNNLDRWVHGFLLKRHGTSLPDIFDNKNEEFKEEVVGRVKGVAFSGIDREIAKKKANFYIDEIEWIKGRMVETETEYVEMQRRGRGVANRVTREDRHLLWKFKEIFDQNLRSLNCNLFADRIILAINELKKRPLASDELFDHVIVDEAQDFTLAKLRLISLIAHGGDLESRGISLFADVAQSIYESGFSWKEANIAVAGNRSFTFNNNYRNTKEIAKAALSLIEHNEEEDVVKMTIPERKGSKPLLIKGGKVELNTIIMSIPKDETCVIGVDKNEIRKKCVDFLSKRYGYEVMSEGSSKLSYKAGKKVIHVRTFHKLKGLQFDNVILILKDDSWYYCSNEEDKEKKRKLLYVAMTRACKKLVICATRYSYSLVDEIDSNLLEVRNV